MILLPPGPPVLTLARLGFRSWGFLTQCAIGARYSRAFCTRWNGKLSKHCVAAAIGRFTGVERCEQHQTGKPRWKQEHHSSFSPPTGRHKFLSSTKQVRVADRHRGWRLRVNSPFRLKLSTRAVGQKADIPGEGGSTSWAISRHLMHFVCPAGGTESGRAMTRKRHPKIPGLK
jgi:hypothetical protein